MFGWFCVVDEVDMLFCYLVVLVGYFGGGDVCFY